jgi:CHASE2 domain-containing sensor protein
MLASAHGLVGTLVFLVALAIALAGTPAPAYREPYLLLWLVPVAFVGVSLLRFRGPRRTHLLLLPLLAAMGWALVVSYTVVGGGK